MYTLVARCGSCNTCKKRFDVGRETIACHEKKYYCTQCAMGIMPLNGASTPANTPVYPKYRTWDYSDEQGMVKAHWLNFPKHNLTVQAGPGCGKTSTALALAEDHEVRAMYKRMLIISFGKNLTNETAEKALAHGIDADVKTCHAFGRGAIVRKVGQLSPNQVNNYKDKGIVNNLLPYPDDCTDDMCVMVNDMRNNLFKMVSACKSWALTGSSEDCQFLLNKYNWNIDEQVLSLVQTAMLDSLMTNFTLPAGMLHTAENIIKHGRWIKGSVISFDDMIYIPVIMGWPLADTHYNAVIIDEVQDFTFAMGRIVQMIALTGAKVMLIGDVFQSIYGFRFADTEGMDRLSAALNCDLLPLMTTRRCSKEVVAYACEVIPECGLVAHPDNPQGERLTLSWDDMLERVQDGDAILSRVNFPLVAVCFELLAMGKKAFINGKDDIEEKINAIINRVTKKKNNITTIEEFYAQLEKEKEKDTAKLDKRKAGKMAHGMLADTFKCINIIIGHCETLGDINTTLDKIFNSGNKGIVLSTGHSAKGTEFNNVFIALPEKFPSKYAQTDEEKRQERHVLYVVITRAKYGIYIAITPKKR